MSAAKPPPTDDPLDETIWRNPMLYNALGRRLTFDTVMQYFHESSFYDPNSNNGMLISNMQSNLQIGQSIQSQEAFNTALRSMIGTEFIPVAGNDKSSEGPPVWVIRQQKRFGKGLNEVVRMNTFFVVGENIYQAPTIGEVLTNKLLAITNRLRTSLDIATTAIAAQTAAATSVSGPASTSTSISAPSSVPPPSSQNVSTPASISGSAPATSSQAVPGAPQPTLSRARQDQMMLHHALQMSLQYPDDCLDDHGPLLDNPGSLVGSQQSSQAVNRGSVPGR